MWLRERLAQRIDGSSLGLFRVIWGILLVWEACRKLPKATGMYSPDYFHFKYSLVPFIKPLPEVWMMQTEIWIMIIAGVLLTLGIWFKYTNTLYGIIYTHLFLLEKLYYNNHFYLTILIIFILTFTQADKVYSLSWFLKRRKGDHSITTVPFWNLAILRAQWVIVYFFGGIAKLNSDWLAGEPVRYWFMNRPDDHMLAFLLHSETFIWCAIWGGLLLDLFGGFALLHKKTRIPTMLVMVMFHGMNHSIFKIGLFPLLAIASLLLFAEPHRPRWIYDKIVSWIRKKPASFEFISEEEKKASPLKLGATVAIIGFLVFQTLWPLRILTYNGNTSWTEVGHSFSWRMMLRHKDAYMQLVFDPPEAVL